MATIDKNLPALLDEQAYTVECTYNKSTKRYTFVSNLQPKLEAGETVLVTEAGSESKLVPATDNEGRALSATELAVLRGAQRTVARITEEFRKDLAFIDFQVFLEHRQLKGEFEAAAAIVRQHSGVAQEAQEQKIALGFVAVRVVEVHDRVCIEPGSDIPYKWIAARVDAEPYIQLMARNQQIVDAYADAYTKNLRRSFATQVLSELDPTAAGNIKALLAAPVAASVPPSQE